MGCRYKENPKGIEESEEANCREIHLVSGLLRPNQQPNLKFLDNGPCGFLVGPIEASNSQW